MKACTRLEGETSVTTLKKVISIQRLRKFWYHENSFAWYISIDIKLYKEWEVGYTQSFEFKPVKKFIW